jgi:hypothetical protein
MPVANNPPLLLDAGGQRTATRDFYLIPLLSLAQPRERWGECTGGSPAVVLHVLSPRAFTASHLSL